ncbi:hypothetical protein [Bdellovibrio sp. HCB337]|uniref:hypothetical protein n=1 Tax=Bdellovibrio sp. HCB337 TaxID=3394358 RepID=UPI0039A404A7
MKTIIPFFILVFGLNSFADCNLKVATAAGQYMAELEKAKLTKYQNNSVCEVLSYEVSNCSKAQKAKLENAFNLKEVLYNYCQPHLPPPQNIGLPPQQLMKGAELYSWKDHSGYYWYALLPGTNANKETKQLLENKLSEGNLKMHLANLPADTYVSWNSVMNIKDKEKLEFSYPSAKVSEEIKATALQAKLQLSTESSK